MATTQAAMYTALLPVLESSAISAVISDVITAGPIAESDRSISGDTVLVDLESIETRKSSEIEIGRAHV